jgi:hypothetical protein
MYGVKLWSMYELKSPLSLRYHVDLCTEYSVRSMYLLYVRAQDCPYSRAAVSPERGGETLVNVRFALDLSLGRNAIFWNKRTRTGELGMIGWQALHKWLTAACLPLPAMFEDIQITVVGSIGNKARTCLRVRCFIGFIKKSVRVKA